MIDTRSIALICVAALGGLIVGFGEGYEYGMRIARKGIDKLQRDGWIVTFRNKESQ